MTDSYQSPPAAPDEVSPLAAAPPPSPEEEALAQRLAAEAALPEDLRAPWDLADLLIFFVFGFGMLFLVTSGMATLAIRMGYVKPENINEFARTNAGFVVLHQIVWFGVLLGYLSAVLRVRTEEPVWRALGWRGLPGRATSVDGQIVPAGKSALSAARQVALLLAGGALLAFFVQLASVLVGTNQKLPIQALFADRRSILYMMGFGVAVAPLAEETIFRGFLYPLLARRFGVVASVVFTGTFFGLMHAEQLWGGWGEIGLLIIVGMVFTAARARSGSVAVSYLLHLGYNGLLFLGTYFATGGLRHFPAGK